MKTIETADGWRETEPMIAKRLEGGVDYGTDGHVLAACRGKRLVWRKGHTAWSGIGCQSYYPAHLQILAVGSNWSDLMSGGRFSMNRIATEKARDGSTVESKIKRAFGVDRLPELKIGKTVVFDG